MVKLRRQFTVRLWVLGLLGAGALAAALLMALAAPATTAAPDAATTVPEVIGPIPSTAAPGDLSHNYIFYSTPLNLAKVVYEEDEYFIRGVATRYNAANPSTGNRSTRCRTRRGSSCVGRRIPAALGALSSSTGRT